MTNHPPLSNRLELFEYYWYTLDLELQIDSSVLSFIVIMIRYLRFFRDKSSFHAEDSTQNIQRYLSTSCSGVCLKSQTLEWLKQED